MPQQDNPLFTLVSGKLSFSTSMLTGPLKIGKQANFQEQGILNRSSPVIIYRDSTPISFNAGLTLLAHDREDWSSTDINNLMVGLLSLEYPQEAGVRPPNLCYLTFGSGAMFDNWPAVLTSVDIDYGGIVYDEEGDPMMASLNLTFKGVDLQNVDADEFGGEAISAYKNLSYG